MEVRLNMSSFNSREASRRRDKETERQKGRRTEGQKVVEGISQPFAGPLRN